MSKFYDLKAALPKGTFDFHDLEGKPVLIVNVASKCGLTPQYKGLQSLYDKYKSQGLEIVGFPCNQFGSQEPGTDDEILQFCERNHGVTFPLMKKSDVNGENTNEVYKYLKSETVADPIEVGLENFAKFLVDRKGNVVKRYSPKTAPADIDGDIEKLL